MISAVSLQRFIGDESKIATMLRIFVLIIMSYPSYRRHACLYLFTRRPRPQVSTCRVMYITCTFLLPLARFGGYVPVTCPGALSFRVTKPSRSFPPSVGYTPESE